MLLSSSIETDNHNGAIEKLERRSEKSHKELFSHLYGFMLLSGSIESDDRNGAIEKFERRSDKVIIFFLYLYAFMLLSGSIASDNYNGLLKNLRSVRINSYREFFPLLWLHDLKW